MFFSKMAATTNNQLNIDQMHGGTAALVHWTTQQITPVDIFYLRNTRTIRRHRKTVLLQNKRYNTFHTNHKDLFDEQQFTETYRFRVEFFCLQYFFGMVTEPTVYIQVLWLLRS